MLYVLIVSSLHLVLEKIYQEMYLRFTPPPVFIPIEC